MAGKIERVMIISAKVGAGHIRASQALAEVFCEKHPDIEVKEIEALAYTNAAFRKTFTATYNRLAVSLPSLWGIIYGRLERKEVDGRIQKLSALLNRLNTRPMLREVDEFDPDHIICTHYLPAEALEKRRRKGELRSPVSAVLTDYDIHTMWVQDGGDQYYVATDEMAHAMMAKGIGEAGVKATGIPIVPVFSHEYPDRRTMRERLGLRPDPPTVLVSAGGFGFGKVDEVAGVLADAFEDIQLLAVAGRDEELYSGLQAAAAGRGGKVVPFGFVTNMHELMAASDFAVAKCGGLTSSECLAMKLPMVIVNPIPGQEERNSDYLLENGAALRANSSAHLVYKVSKLLDDGARLERMRGAIGLIAKPRAAYDIVADVCSAGMEPQINTD